ncbi:MAG: rod shape-determining protein MreC [Actinomycetota bacterium]|nr:rod shape-determining protein MreC [Actinomycetota bacterium]
MATTYRRRSRTRSILIVAVLAAITLITLDARSNGRGTLGSIRGWVNDAFSPIQSAAHSGLAPVGNFLSGAASYGSLRSENQRLRNQISSMQAQAVASAASQKQAQAVLAQAHLSFVGSTPTVLTRVIGGGSSNFENTVTIDKGTTNGLAVGQPVVAPGGLVGNISAASAKTATVDLLTNPNFVVGVRLDDNVVASAQGFGRSSMLRVTFDQPPDVGFHLGIGEALVTSGLELEKFPPGIPVAKVASVKNPAGAPNPIVALRPIVSLAQLDFLTVELWSPP